MKLFTYPELLREIERVKILLVTNKKQFTIRQNRKYLAKLEKERKEFEKWRKEPPLKEKTVATNQ